MHRLDKMEWEQGPRKIVFLSLMTTLAMSLQIIESIFPNPLPWIRIGLANIIILVILVLFGIKEGLIVTLVRVFMASILLGTIFGPTFWLSLSAGVTSTVTMGLMMNWFSERFSIIGVSIFGAYIHNLTQLLVVSFFIIKDSGIFNLLPILLITAFIAGMITGTAATFVIEKIELQRLLY